jgi:hypothetical protein
MPCTFFRERQWALFFLVAWMCVIFVFSSFPGSAVRYEMPLSLYLERKGAHVIEFFVLTMLAWNAFRAFLPHARGGLLVGLSVAFSISYAFLDEAHQTFVPFREGKLSDVGIDMIGIVLFALSYVAWTRFRKTTAS